MPPRAARRETADEALDVAERLVQTRGFNGFSYADAAQELGITKAALHYHFASKAELGEALIARYAARFTAALGVIDAADSDAMAKLHAYAALYGQVLQAERMCLCGMLAAEYETLPPAMRAAVMQFFTDNESWLRKVIEQGQTAGQLRAGGTAAETARLVVGSLEGAMLVSRLHGDPELFGSAVARLLAALT